VTEAEQRVVDYLRQEYPWKISGRDLRDMLNDGLPWWKFWRYWSGPAFYAMMARLVDACEVERIDQPSRMPGCDRIIATYFRWVPSRSDE
jgi:hypothetical protein